MKSDPILLIEKKAIRREKLGQAVQGHWIVSLQKQFKALIKNSETKEMKGQSSEVITET